MTRQLSLYRALLCCAVLELAHDVISFSLSNPSLMPILIYIQYIHMGMGECGNLGCVFVCVCLCFANSSRKKTTKFHSIHPSIAIPIQ